MEPNCIVLIVRACFYSPWPILFIQSISLYSEPNKSKYKIPKQYSQNNTLYVTVKRYLQEIVFKSYCNVKVIFQYTMNYQKSGCHLHNLCKFPAVLYLVSTFCYRCRLDIKTSIIPLQTITYEHEICNAYFISFLVKNLCDKWKFFGV